MIETIHIKKMVEHILRRQRGVADREAMDPNREWLIGVGVTILLVVGGGIASYSLYLNTISLEVNADHIPAVAIPYNAAVVDGVVETFRTRARAYNDIRGAVEDVPTEPVTPVVPSETPAIESTPVEAGAPEGGVTVTEDIPVEEASVVPAEDAGVPELGV